MENWMNNWRGDLIDELEEMRDYANSVFAAYFNYAMEKEIDTNDTSHPIARNLDAVNDIARGAVYDCKSHEEFAALKEQLDDMMKQLKEYDAGTKETVKKKMSNCEHEL